VFKFFKGALSFFVCILFCFIMSLFFDYMCTRLPFFVWSIAGVASSQALPGFLIIAPPPMLVPALLVALAVWIQNPKKKNRMPKKAGTATGAAQGPGTGSRCMRGTTSPSHVARSKHALPLTQVRSCGPSSTIVNRRSGRPRMRRWLWWYRWLHCKTRLQPATGRTRHTKLTPTICCPHEMCQIQHHLCHILYDLRECPWAGRFWGNLLLCTTCMRSWCNGSASGMTA